MAPRSDVALWSDLQTLLIAYGNRVEEYGMKQHLLSGLASLLLTALNFALLPLSVMEHSTHQQSALEQSTQSAE
jgi:hypothetical protein